MGGVGGHQHHCWRPEAAPHIVQGGVGAHCPDVKQALGEAWPAGDDLQRHLEIGGGERSGRDSGKDKLEGGEKGLEDNSGEITGSESLGEEWTRAQGTLERGQSRLSKTRREEGRAQPRNTEIPHFLDLG